MNRTLAVALALGLFTTAPAHAYQQRLSDSASSVAQDMLAHSKHRLGIADLTDLRASATEAGAYLADEVTALLMADKPPFAIVDRSTVRAMLAQNHLSSAEEPTALHVVGEIANLDAVLTGTVAPFADHLRLTLKLTDTESARMLAIRTVDLTPGKDLQELMARDARNAGNPVRIASAAPAVPSTATRGGSNSALQTFLGQAPKSGAPTSPSTPVAAGASGKTYQLSGTIEGVDRNAKSLSVKHGKIEGWMEAMTMLYPVDDPTVLDQVDAGDEITATVYDGDYSLHKIAVTKRPRTK